jgi:hypothetical protein
MSFLRQTILIAAVCLAPLNASATKAKLDTDACDALRLEEIKFRQSGILNDMSKGATWAKSNLPADRLRDIQHYLEIEEQVQFGCRDAKVTAEAKRASEAAARIELNSDADPTAPSPKDPPKPGAAAAKDADKTVKKKVQKAKSSKPSKGKESKAHTAPHPPVVAQSQTDDDSAGGSPDASAGDSTSQAPSLPAFGFGQAEVLPWSSP